MYSESLATYIFLMHKEAPKCEEGGNSEPSHLNQCVPTKSLALNNLVSTFKQHNRTVFVSSMPHKLKT